MESMDFFALPSTGQVLAIVFAFLLSASIGIERELRHKDAGIRTHVLVGLGSCLFTLISINGAPALLSGNTSWDAARIAAQVVSGIGFIGAGVIWFNHDAIRGLTTASAIWVAAAIGMACGAQMFFLALLVVVAYFLLVLVFAPLFYAITRRTGQVVEISYVEKQGVLKAVLLEITQRGFESQVIAFRQNKYADRRETVVDIRLKGGRDVDSLLSWLSEYEGVLEAKLADEGE
jgi:putative Mg2+ transporter-C (MgtC) family protein